MRKFIKRTGRNDRPQVWLIGVDESNPRKYISRWGLEGGAMQETSDEPGDCGDPTHCDYKTAEEYVFVCIERDIKKKIESGYVEVIDGKEVATAATQIDFNRLPKNLCFYKPNKSISDKEIKNLRKKNCVWTRKRDGMMHIAVKNNDWQIYSRRMDIETEKYPHVINALNELNIPDKTILLGEMCFIEDNYADNFKKVSRICRSKKDLALSYQGIINSTEVIGKLNYYIFDIAFYENNDLSNKTFGYRLNILNELFKNKLTDSKLLKEFHVAPVEIYNTDFDKDIQLAKKLKIEGFVVVDLDSVFGDKMYSFDGKSSRPKGSYKRKPSNEQEFFITGVYEGSGRNKGKLGGFSISQINPLTGLEISCGECGGGFTDQQREEYWDDKENMIGKTIKVEFDSRQTGTFALRFPVFLGITDKVAAECVAEDIDE